MSIKIQTLQQLKVLNVPGIDEIPYKTESEFVRSPQLTIKFTSWWEPDSRKEHHNHPADFESTILSGGYVEEKNGDTFVYTRGAVNRIKASEYHNVVDVFPNTCTLMIWGEMVNEKTWGYLVDKSHVVFTELGDPLFREKLMVTNPSINSQANPKWLSYYQDHLSNLKANFQAIQDILAPVGYRLSHDWLNADSF